jgi:hypothetical protein
LGYLLTRLGKTTLAEALQSHLNGRRARPIVLASDHKGGVARRIRVGT